MCVCVCARTRVCDVLCVCTCCVHACVMCDVHERVPPPLLRDRGDDICVIVCGVCDNIN